MRNLKREAEVRALLKQGGAEPGDRLSFFAADLENDAGWREAVAGCEYVLHVASPFPQNVPKNEDELIVPAREGALRVLRAARDAGVKRVVLTSSFAAIGYGHKPQASAVRRDELDGPQRRRRPAVRQIEDAWPSARPGISSPGKAAGLELSVVNPVAVFGPVLGPDYSTSILLVQRLMDGAVPGCPRLYFGVVDVRDVADLHIRAMTIPPPRASAFLRVAGDFMSIREIAEVLKTRMGAAAKTRADPASAELAGAHRRVARSGGATNPAGAGQDEECHQRKGEAAAGLVAALERGCHRRHRRKPGAARAPEGQREESGLNIVA